MKTRDSIEAELIQRIGPEISGFGTGKIERYTDRATFTLALRATPSPLPRTTDP